MHGYNCRVMGRSSSFAAMAVVFALGVAACARTSKGTGVSEEDSANSTSTPTSTAEPSAEEREAKRIDSLVALDRIGEAHTAAMLFVQRHPSGPFSAHVMNLMGVHPRPHGAVPEPPEAEVGR